MRFLNSELVSLKENLKIKIGELSYLRQEIILAVDASVRYSYNVRIQNIEIEINDLKRKIEEIEKSNTNNSYFFDNSLDDKPEMKTEEIELTINRRFEDYSEDDQQKLVAAITFLLNLKSGDVKIVSKKRGSIKIVISIPSDKVDAFINALNDNILKQYDIDGWSIIKNENELLQISGIKKKQNELTISKSLSQSSLTLAIENYSKAFDKKSLKEHSRTLNIIGREFDKVGPSNISLDDLEKLEKLLVKVRQIMKADLYSNDEIRVINQVIAKIATLSRKNPKSRTEKINVQLVELGDWLITLATLLSSLVAILIVQSVIEHITKN